MKQFLGVHSMDQGAGLTEDKIADSFQAYKDAAKSMGLTALHVHYSVEKGFGYCVTEANTEEEVREAHKKANVPVDDVIEVKTVN